MLQEERRVLLQPDVLRGEDEACQQPTGTLKQRSENRSSGWPSSRGGAVHVERAAGGEGDTGRRTARPSETSICGVTEVMLPLPLPQAPADEAAGHARVRALCLHSVAPRAAALKAAGVVELAHAVRASRDDGDAAMAVSARQSS